MTATSMKKFLGSIKRSSKSQPSDKSTNGTYIPQTIPEGDSPDAIAVREVIAFCEAGAPGAATAGEEYLHLPAIVDAAESSPSAAREAAACIQRFLSKQNYERGFAQYNAIMLTRILTDNPGHNFTQNFDKQFVSVVKALLRDSRDSSVQQIMRETLDYFEVEKLNGNETLMPLIEMWRKEKGSSARMYTGSTVHPHANAARNVQPRPPRRERGLPPADELVARIEESKTSARLLVQMVQTTPQNELLHNDLIKEFAERTRQAHQSIQVFMGAENPAPDEATMLTLIETSEQLNVAMTKHQRAILAARKAAGSAQSTPQPQATVQDPFSTVQMHNALPPSGPPRPTQQDQRSQGNNLNQSYGNVGQAPKDQSTYLVSPVEPESHSFMPPPGPPPKRTEDRVPSSPPVSSVGGYQETVSPPRSNDRSSYQAPVPVSPTATRDYDVSENPFSDDAYAADPTPAPAPQQKYQSYQTPQNHSYQAYQPPSGPPSQTQPPAATSQAEQPGNTSYSLFNRAAGQLRSPTQPPVRDFSDSNARPGVVELDAGNYPPVPPTHSREERPAGPHSYNSGWQPTPSYIHRQDSATANMTMHGASPTQSPS